MDFRIIEFGETFTILLARTRLGEEMPWQVIISTFSGLDHEYEECVGFPSPQAAQRFIADYSKEAQTEYITRAMDKFGVAHP